ncbi:MAG: FprA family A-type flavoprotein [Candidatus Thermoplasmatota archaeon]
MPPRTLRPGVTWVGAIDWHRRLFDEIIPLPDGTSYNSYLVEGKEKNALIDAVDPRTERELVANLDALKVKNIDYVVANHAEQDHSGAIPKVLEMYPGASVVTNHRCMEMLRHLLHIPEDRFMIVNDRDILHLGGRTLEFLYAPWVHWPETMFTYLREDKILFTCDFLGAHLATSDLYATDEPTVFEAAKRYYAEIMMPFRTHIQKHLALIRGMEFDIIAPSHGPIYNRPEFILKAYEDWAGDAVKNEVVVAYVSMHGSTKVMAEHLTSALMTRGVGVRLFDLTVTDIGELAKSLVDCATLVIAAPAVLGGPHPSALYAAYLVRALKPKLRFLGIVGSYGWGSRMLEDLKGIVGSLSAELFEPVIVKGLPGSEDLKRMEILAEEIAKRHDDLRIIQETAVR